MAERKFDYQEVSNIYNKMNDITGSAGDSSSIAGILHDTDKLVAESVGVMDESIYGDLGSQLLLDWENLSSDFDGFVENFGNWSALIAQAAGKYQQFESDVAGFREANPLGVTAKGRTSNYISTSKYASFTTESVTAAIQSVGGYHSLLGTSAFYDTKQVEAEENRSTAAGISLALNVVSVAASAFSIFNAVKGITAASSAANGASNTANAASSGSTALSNTTNAASSTSNAAQIFTGPIDDLANMGVSSAGVAAMKNAGAASYVVDTASGTYKILDSAGKILESGALKTGATAAASTASTAVAALPAATNTGVAVVSSASTSTSLVPSTVQAAEEIPEVIKVVDGFAALGATTSILGKGTSQPVASQSTTAGVAYRNPNITVGSTESDSSTQQPQTMVQNGSGTSVPQLATEESANNGNTAATASGYSAARSGMSAYSSTTGSSSSEQTVTTTSNGASSGEEEPEVLDETPSSSSSTNVSNTTVDMTSSQQNDGYDVLNSGNAVKINESDYYFYGGVKQSDGEITMLYADNVGNLYQSDGQGNLIRAKSEWVDGSGTVRTTEANINSLGTVHTCEAHGTSYNVTESLAVGNGKVTKKEELVSSIQFSKGTTEFKLNTNANGTAYVSNGVSISVN